MGTKYKHITYNGARMVYQFQSFSHCKSEQLQQQYTISFRCNGTILAPVAIPQLALLFLATQHVVYCSLSQHQELEIQTN